MTDEERARKAICKNCSWTKSCLQDSKYDCRCIQAWVKGLAEGRKEVREHETTCVVRLHFIEKENEELKEQIKKMKSDWAEAKKKGLELLNLKIKRINQLETQVEEQRCKNVYAASDEYLNSVPCYTVYNCKNCPRKEPAE